MAASLEQLVRTGVLLREVNERIAEILNAWGDDAAGEFLCECSNDDCGESLTLSPLEYKGIRSSPEMFIVLAGHETSEVDRVVAAHAGFSLVENTEHVDFVVRRHRNGVRPEGR
jgi:hypothetical protein